MSNDSISLNTESTPPEQPNILMVMVDQLRYPRFSYGEAGLTNDIKDILSFVNDLENNNYLDHFPGFLKLREYSTVLTDHTIAESACIPSRGSIMTGQYGPRTGVTQTDGLFKSGDAQNFPWLKHDGFATIGDWFREAGYSTHYFGKWHTSNPPEHSLKSFGFDDWELSWPEPHGSSVNNLGTYRDYQFADLAAGFLHARGLGVPFNRASAEQAQNNPEDSSTPETKPFFAVCSFTNPHDIATYPTLPRSLQPVKEQKIGPGGSVPVPVKDSYSKEPTQGTFQVPLNPTGLPQQNATASPTQNEDLTSNNKPSCQYDYSIKLGLGLAAKAGLGIAQSTNPDLDRNALIEEAVKHTMKVAIPFQTQKDPDGAATGFLQYYAYMISMVDRHILTVLNALEDSGLSKDTIVVFASDHGEYGAAHSMMMEKWHTAYQEMIHVPVLVKSPWVNPKRDKPASFDAPTSHIDLLPTLLGLANIPDEKREQIRSILSKDHKAARLPGIDLATAIRRTGHPVVSANPGSLPPVIPPEFSERPILFVTDDMITEPLPKDDDPHNHQSWLQYEVFTAAVEQLRTEKGLSDLSPGAVVQPAHVRAVRQGAWKLVRYCDPWSKVSVDDQWELYNLDFDGTESINLLIFNGEFPTPIAEDNFPEGLNMTQEELADKANELRNSLSTLEALHLSPYPSEYPTAGAAVGA